MSIKNNLETYYTVHLGRCLGFYQALATAGAITPAELAVKTGAHEGYVRHWLEEQTEAGLVEAEETSARTKLFKITSELAHQVMGELSQRSRRLW